MVLHSREVKTAPCSSRRGMVYLFSGATLDFAAIKRTSYSPIDFCHRAYAQEPNASLEASEEMQRTGRPTAPGGARHLLNVISLRLSIS